MSDSPAPMHPTAEVAFWAGCGLPAAWAQGLRYLSNSSYALFLVHFSILVLGNAWFSQLTSASATSAGVVLLTCWLVSMGLALLFVRWVERPLSRLGSTGS